MKPSRVRSYGRLLLGGMVLIGALAAGPLLPQSTYAHLSGCKTDPIVMLSDGTQISITDTVADSPDDLRQITYVVHVPVGTNLKNVVYTSGLGSIESLTFYADLPAGGYSTESRVTAITSTSAAVSMTSTVYAPDLGSKTASGSAGDSLTLAF